MGLACLGGRASPALDANGWICLFNLRGCHVGAITTTQEPAPDVLSSCGQIRRSGKLSDGSRWVGSDSFLRLWLQTAGPALTPCQQRYNLPRHDACTLSRLTICGIYIEQYNVRLRNQPRYFRPAPVASTSALRTSAVYRVLCHCLGGKGVDILHPYKLYLALHGHDTFFPPITG